jgi:hypothetical protein
MVYHPKTIILSTRLEGGAWHHLSRQEGYQISLRMEAGFMKEEMPELILKLKKDTTR